MADYEPCSICEEYIEGVICDKDKCPVGIMKKELDRLHKLQNPTKTSGYRLENGKVVFYTNILNGYRHEYVNLEEVVKELNLQLRGAYRNDEVLSHYKGKLRTAKSEAIKEFAERVKPMMFGYYDCLKESAEGRPYKGDTLMDYEVVDMIEDCIDNLVKEMAGTDK